MWNICGKAEKGPCEPPKDEGHPRTDSNIIRTAEAPTRTRGVSQRAAVPGEVLRAFVCEGKRSLKSPLRTSHRWKTPQEHRDFGPF